jgi:predicted MPP superfamily phosphohydrolase
MIPKSPGFRVGFATAVAISAFAALAWWALRPLHEAGYGQPLLGYVQGLDHLLQAPALLAAQRVGLRAGRHTTPAAWGFAVTVNAGCWFLVGAIVGSLWHGLASPPSAPRLSRRRFLKGGLQLACAGAGIGLGYGLLVEPRRFVIRRQEIALPGLPRALDGLRIVQLTDIHHGPWLSLPYVEAVVRAANELEPDVVCLTGDYVHHSAAYIEPVVAALAQLRPRIGTLAVLGNHDWWEDASLVRRELAKTSIVLIDNDRRILTPERRLVTAAETGLALCGVGDLWEDVPDYERALGGLPAPMPRLLLSHNPDVAEELAFRQCGLRVDLMLSGHTHGGQISLPGVGRPITSSNFGDKYAQGLVQGPTCPVFVCTGIGVSAFPLRLGVPPEIAVLELKPLAA